MLLVHLSHGNQLLTIVSIFRANFDRAGDGRRVLSQANVPRFVSRANSGHDNVCPVWIIMSDVDRQKAPRWTAI